MALDPLLDVVGLADDALIQGSGSRKAHGELEMTQGVKIK
jgi:hypothetical protein